jgi:uncharacterized protein (DUF433 family)
MAGMMTAFSIQRAAKLAGLTPRQLEYWDEQDVIRPSIAGYGGRGEPRLYSFTDLIALKVAAKMRRKWRPSRIRESIRQLEARGFDDPLVTLCWVVESGGNEVLYIDPGTGTPMSGHAPQQIADPMDLRLLEIRTGLEASIAEMVQRPHGRIEKVRQVGSEPVVYGTRVPAAKLAHLAAAGWPVEQIVAAYPTVTEEDVRAAIEYERGRRRRSASA